MKIYALHGNLGLPEDWNAVEQTLGRPVEKIHLWQSAVEPFDQWAQQFVDRTEPDSLLIGYSLGGRLALHALLTSPAHFRRVIILSAHPGLESAEERRSRLLVDQTWAEKCRILPWETFLEEWNSQPVFSKTGAPDSSGHCEPWREQIARAFDIWSLGRQESLTNQLASVAGRLLWLTGNRDEKFTRIAEQLSRQTGIEHRVISNAGHRLLQDRPDAVAAVLSAQMSHGKLS